jgi:hypothetical protein
MTELTIDEMRELRRHLMRHITPDAIWRNQIIRDELTSLAHSLIDESVINAHVSWLVEDWECRIAEAIQNQITSIIDGKTQELLRRRNE